MTYVLIALAGVALGFWLGFRFGMMGVKALIEDWRKP